jgi:hypothetical protein
LCESQLSAISGTGFLRLVRQARRQLSEATASPHEATLQACRAANSHTGCVQATCKRCTPSVTEVAPTLAGMVHQPRHRPAAAQQFADHCLVQRLPVLQQQAPHDLVCAQLTSLLLLHIAEVMGCCGVLSWCALLDQGRVLGATAAAVADERKALL